MCEFISLLEGEKPKFGKPPILYLTDSQVWNSEAGRKLLEYDKGLEQESNANGHGAIKKFYELSEDAWNKCKRIHQQDFSSPKNFPRMIANDIKELKMVRMSKGSSCYHNLLNLLNEESQYKVIAEQAVYKYKWDTYNNKIQNANLVFNEEMLENIEFKKGTPLEKQEEILLKIKRIFDDGEASCRENRYKINNILSFFFWDYTREDKNYWYEIYSEELILPLKIKGIPCPETYSNFWMYDMIWELFKDINNRNPLWR